MYLRFPKKNTTLIRLLNKSCKNHGFSILTYKICDIINKREKKRQILHLIGKKAKNACPSKVRSEEKKI